MATLVANALAFNGEDSDEAAAALDIQVRRRGGSRGVHACLHGLPSAARRMHTPLNAKAFSACMHAGGAAVLVHIGARMTQAWGVCGGGALSRMYMYVQHGVSVCG